MDPLNVTLTCQDADELAGLYVLDALEPADTIAVSAHLQACPEAHPVFAELAATSSQLVASVEPLDTPLAMKDRVMAAVAATPQVHDVPSTAPPAAAQPTPPAAPPAAQPAPAAPPPAAAPAGTVPVADSWFDRLRGGAAGTERRDGWAWAGLAAGVFVILLVGVGILGAFRLTVDESDRLDLLRQAVAAASSDSANVAVLGGEAAGAAFGYAVFPDDGDGFIVIDGLTPPGADQTYQAWYLVGDQPSSAGLLAVGDDGLATLTGLDPEAGTSVIAVTVEELPGAEAPTSDPILAGELSTATAAAGGGPAL